MMEKMSAEVMRRVKLQNLFDERIIIESKSEYKKSVFAPIYKKADSLVDEFKHNSSSKDQDKRRLEALQIVNTISFEGRRGTGKTSAMMSFCNQLSERKRERDEKETFIVLDYIDASALEEGESILEIVLANMYHKLSESMEKRNKTAQVDYESRNIIRKFEEIYRSINFISERRNKKGRKVDLSPLSGLERLSNSQQLKKEICDLIRVYTRHIACEDAMLVIPIDDIDMCFQSEEPSVYEVMETLHRYLMIPNVVIFLTYDYPELLSGCEKHFAQMHYIKNGFTDSQKSHIRQAANRYLEKVLPTYARIHLPSQKKRDYSDQNNIQVCLESTKENDEITAYLKQFKDYLAINDDKTVNLNPKQFALLFKASNCGLFYDSQGQKRHYAEPSDFRDMVHIVTMCKRLSKSYNLDTYDEDEFVFKELLDDLYFRFARVKLDSGEYRSFNEYLEVNIERRSKNILDDIWIKLKEVEPEKVYSKIQYVDQNRGDQFEGQQNRSGERYEGRKDTTDIVISDERKSYSYGELLYWLYRVSNNGVFSKPLIWCILDSYTIMLTKLHRAVERKKREYKKAYIEKNKNEYSVEKLLDEAAEESLNGVIREKGFFDAYDSIKGIIGPSISSCWSNYYVPKLIDYVSKTNDDEPESQERSRVGAIKFIDSNLNTRMKRRAWRLEIMGDEDKDESIIQTIEVLCMFFTEVKGERNYSGFKITYNDGKDAEVNPKKQDKFFDFEFRSGCFNIMNFVNNLFFGEEFFGELHEQLNKAINDKTYFNKLKEHSLYNGFRIWKNKYGNCAMPLYSFDMMYNIMKRQYLDTIKKNPYIDSEEVSVEEYLKRLLGVYDDIRIALQKQDKFYYNNKNNTDEEIVNKGHFENAFVECPFIGYMSNIKAMVDGNENVDERITYLHRFFDQISLVE